MSEVSNRTGSRSQVKGGRSRPKNSLTQKQEIFCNNIFLGMSQYDAYKAAGYGLTAARATTDANASRLANDGKIRARLAELNRKAEDSTIGTVQERQRRLTEIYRANITDYQETGADGSWPSIGKESPNKGALAEVTSHTREDGTVVTKLKLHDPVKAIAEHNKMTGAYEPVRVDITEGLGKLLKKLRGRDVPLLEETIDEGEP